MSKHKRNLVIAGGVTLSVIVSPVVAAVTVGKLVMFFSLPLFHHQFLTYNVILCLFVFWGFFFWWFTILSRKTPFRLVTFHFFPI